MAYAILIADEAKLNIKNASDYYEKISTSLKNRFIIQLTKTIDSLKENPLQYQIRYREIRIAYTKIFSFGIHFIVEDEMIYILNVLHTRQFYK